MGLRWTQRCKGKINSHKGFTLIELMIVIAIIGVLASIAIPQYTLFTNRSFVASEALSAARPFQIAVSEYYLVNQKLPTGASELTLASLTGDTPHIESVSVASDGTAKLTISFASSSARLPNDIKGKSLVLQPVLNAVSQNASWSVDITGSTIPSEYLPRL